MLREHYDSSGHANNCWKGRICFHAPSDAEVCTISANDAGSGLAELPESQLNLLGALPRTILSPLKLDPVWTPVNNFRVWVRALERPYKHASVHPSSHADYVRISAPSDRRPSRYCGHTAACHASTEYIGFCEPSR